MRYAVRVACVRAMGFICFACQTAYLIGSRPRLTRTNPRLLLMMHIVRKSVTWNPDAGVTLVDNPNLCRMSPSWPHRIPRVDVMG